MARMHQEIENGVVIREWPYTIGEELVEDARLYFMQIVRDLVDAPPFPGDIDEWRTAFSPMRAANRWIERKGIDPATVSAENKATLAAALEIAFYAMTFMHGKAPGGPT